jgi:adhesin/invasin
VTVSRPTLVAGTSAELRLVTLDASGDRLRRGGHTVTFTTSGGTSGGLVSAAQDQGDGSYTATFVGRTAGSPTTVGATIDGAPVTHPLPTIEVVPGPLSAIVSYVTVTPRTILNGAQTTLELITRDAMGNQLRGGGHTVQFAVSGGTATGIIGAVQDLGDGSYRASFTATGVGTPLTVGATVDGVPVTTALPTVAVAAGVSPDSSMLTLSSDSISVRGSVTLQLTVRDSSGVPRASGGETVVFTVHEGPGTGRGAIDSTTDHDDGTYTAVFTATAAGSPVGISATLNRVPVGGPTPLVTILPVPIAPQKSSVTLSAGTVAAGHSVTLTLVVRDLDSVQAAEGGLAIRFSTSDGTSEGVIGPTIDHGDGSYTADFMGRVAGSAVTIGAVINDSSQVQMLDSQGESHLPRLTVTAGPLEFDSTTFALTPDQIDLGDSTLMLLSTRDSFGNRLGQGGHSVAFNRTSRVGSSVGRITPVADHGDGDYSAYFVADSAGTPATIRASLDRSQLPESRTVIVACAPGPVSPAVSEITINQNTASQDPAKMVVLPSGVTTTITLHVRDARGCPITAGHLVTFDLGGGTSTGIIGSTLDRGDGTYTASFTGVTAGTAVTVTATIDAAPVTSAPVTITVIPGEISPETSSLSASRAVVDSGAHSLVTLQARDAAGNNLVTGGRIVSFELSNGSAHGVVGGTTDHGNGTYSAVYTGLTVEPAAPDLVTALIGGTPLETAPTAIAVVAGTISPDQSTVEASDAEVPAGDTLVLTLTGRDASGRGLVTGDRSVTLGFTLSGGTSTGSFGPVENPDDGSYRVKFVGHQAGTAATISATINTIPVTTPAPQVTVVSGRVSVAASTISATATAMTVGDNAAVQVEVSDGFGNPVADPGLSIAFSVSPTGAGILGPASYQGGNIYAATFTAQAAGPAVISATLDGVLLVDTATIQVQ